MGVAYLRSYVMDQIGIRSMVYPWTGIPTRSLDEGGVAGNHEMVKDEQAGEKSVEGDSQDSGSESESSVELSDSDEQSLSQPVRKRGKVELSRRGEFGPEKGAKGLKRAMDISPERLKVEVGKCKTVKGMIESWEARVAKTAGLGDQPLRKPTEADEDSSSSGPENSEAND